MLRSESGRDTKIAEGHKRVQRVREVLRHGCRVSEQRDAPACEGLAQLSILQQTVQTEFDQIVLPRSGGSFKGQAKRETIGMMKIGLTRRMSQRPV